MKKGQTSLSAILMFVIVIVVCSFVFLFTWDAFDGMATDIKSDLAGNNQSIAAIEEVEDRYPPLFDGIMLFVFLGFWAAGIISAWVSDEHPMLFAFMMILLVFVIIAAAMLGNFYEDIFTTGDLATIPDTFPITNWIMSNMLIVTIGIGLSILLAYIAKNQG